MSFPRSGLWRLVHLDVSNALKTIQVRALIFGCVVLTVMTTSIGAHDFLFRRAQATSLIDLRSAARTASVATGVGIVIKVSEPAFRAIRFPNPYSIFVRGTDADSPAYWDFGAAGIIVGPEPPSLEPTGAATSVSDAASIARILLGLLSVMLAIELIETQRSRGLLPALLAQPVRPGIILLAKCLAAAIVLGATSATVMVVAGVTVRIEAAPLLSVAVMEFLVGLGLITLTYAFAMFALGTAICVWSRGLGKATTLSLALWIAVSILGPSLVTFVARSLVSPEPPQLSEDLRQRLYLAREDATERVLGNATVRLLGDQAAHISPKTDPVVLAEIDQIWAAESTETRNFVNEISDRDRAEARLLDRLTGWLTLLGPGALYAQAASNYAGTGREAEDSWDEALSHYQSYLERTVFDGRARLMFQVPSDEGTRQVNLLRHPFVISTVMDFEPPAWPKRATFASAFRRSGLLGAYGALALALGLIGIARLRT